MAWQARQQAQLTQRHVRTAHMAPSPSPPSQRLVTRDQSEEPIPKESVVAARHASVGIVFRARSKRRRTVCAAKPFCAIARSVRQQVALHVLSARSRRCPSRTERRAHCEVRMGAVGRNKRCAQHVQRAQWPTPYHLFLPAAQQSAEAST